MVKKIPFVDLRILGKIIVDAFFSIIIKFTREFILAYICGNSQMVHQVIRIYVFHFLIQKDFVDEVLCFLCIFHRRTSQIAKPIFFHSISCFPIKVILISIPTAV